MRKKIIFILFILILFDIKVSALTYGGCDYSTVARLKSLVNNVNISYNYVLENNTAYFSVTLNNITPEVYFMDSLSGNTYTYDNTNNGEITLYGYTGGSGAYKFYSTLGECYGLSLGKKYYTFPVYNIYYNSYLCEGLQNISLCQKWVEKVYSTSEFESKISEYKESLNKKNDEDKKTIEHNKTFIDVIIGFYINYYYYFLIAIIIICTVIMIVNRRKNKFNL